MTKLYFLIISLCSCVLAACPKQTINDETQSLSGTWVREGDMPGRQPADTLFFSQKDGKPSLSFYSAGSPGPGWPSEAKTEYQFQNDKLSFRDYSGNSNDLFKVESFQWLERGKSFSVKLHHLLLYMSADYRVTYKKI